MDPIGENSFIVVSGPPQKGKRERISKVRSHITRRYFRRQNQKSRTSGLQQHAEASAIQPFSLPEQDNSLRRGVESTLPPEIPYTLFSADHPMLDPALCVSETTRRMQKFFDFHMRQDVHRHQFLRHMITWSIIYPHFTSAKLINASGWDDVQDCGELSPWTLCQRFITIRLLDDTLKNESKVPKAVTIAAIQALLGFEILTGNGENYLRLRKFSKSIINQGVPCEDDIWTCLTGGFFLLDQANRLRMAPNKAGEPLVLDLPFDFRFLFPVDFALFTFEHHCPSGDNGLIYSLVGELYYVLSIAESSGEAPVAQSTYDYVASRWSHLYQEVAVDTSQDEIAQGVNENISAAPIRLCIFMLASHLLYGPDFHQNLSLSQLASQLRALLSTTGTGLEYYTAWMPFPGAILWCHAIGVRFAASGDKTWFIMQFLKMSHSWLLQKWEEVSKSICLVSNAVEKMQPMCVAEV